MHHMSNKHTTHNTKTSHTTKTYYTPYTCITYYTHNVYTLYAIHRHTYHTLTQPNYTYTMHYIHYIPHGNTYHTRAHMHIHIMYYADIHTKYCIYRHSTHHTVPLSLRTASTVKECKAGRSLYRVHPHIGLSPSTSMTRKDQHTWERFPFFRRDGSFFSAEREFLWNRVCTM